MLNAKLEEKIVKAVKPYIGMPLALSGGIDSSLLAYLMKPSLAISVELPGDAKFNEIEWAKYVAQGLNIKHVIVTPDVTKFDDYMNIAVKAIGRPIPHFNIFPLFCMYQKLQEMGIKEVVLGDGPDETMCGYARDLIIDYLYKVYDFEAFEDYGELISKILPIKSDAIKAVTGLDGFVDVVSADLAMRSDMDAMSDGIAKYFGIKNIRPYQDDKELDVYMQYLPMDQKIHGEYGKWALRQILAQYLPDVADRKKKMGGPVYPVNALKGWDKTDGEFGKQSYLVYQSEILA